MEYLKALKYDSEVKGAIKCTYLILNDVNGKPIFSLQKARFGDAVIGVGALSQPNEKGLVPILVSQEVKRILSVYAKNFLPLAKFLTDGKDYADRMYYVRPDACNWSPVSAEVTSTIKEGDNGELIEETTVKQKLTGKQKLALAAAAILTLFN